MADVKELAFLVLGPLEIVAGERVLQVSAPRQRALLASLVLRANQPVPVERLVGELWGDDPPDKARVALRMAVVRLRRLLAAAGPDGGQGARLVTRAGGYLLQIEPDQVDAFRFERMTAEGRAVLAAGDAREAARRLRAALALWRGSALAGVLSTTVVAAEAERLELLRLDALEDRLDAELACGRHVEVLTELESLVGEHPLRERLWGQLMVALYRSGRQAQALGAYQQLRRRLVDELGIEPGRQLARLHQAVLRHDPELQPPGTVAGGGTAGAPASAPGHGPVPPDQLPADLTDFVGREDDLARLERMAAAGGAAPAVVISAIDGMSGIGKSALAIRAAHRLAPRFPDGRLYVNLQGATPGLPPLAPLEVLGRFLRALGVAADEIPAEVAEAAAVFRSTVAGRRLLVVLDNAADAAQVTPLLPGAPGCGVLVTSRRVLTSLDGAVHLHLDVLAPGEATALLGRIAGERRVAGEPEAAASVARLCGFLPLALRVAGARLAARPGWPLRALADQLADERSRLAELEAAERGVRASLAVSYEQLRSSGDAIDRAAAGAFGLLGVPDVADISVPAVARLLDRDEPAARGLLERLVDAQLLETSAVGRYRFHDLVRLYARERAAATEPESGRDDAVCRLLRWYLATVRRATLLARPTDADHLIAADDALALPLEGRDDALRWFDAERANLLATVRQAAAMPGCAPLYVALVAALPRLSHRDGYNREWERIYELALPVARELGDPRPEAEVVAELAFLRYTVGDPDGSIRYGEEAVVAYRAAGDLTGEARCLNNLGAAYSRMGRNAEAAQRLEQTLAIARRRGRRRTEAYALANLAAAYRQMGHLDEVVSLDVTAVTIFRELGDRQGEADAADDLALSYRAVGRCDEALTAHHQAIAIARDLADRPREGSFLAGLGTTLLDRGDADAAVGVLEQALEIMVRIGDRFGEVRARRDLGGALHALGDHAGARRCWQEALVICQALRVPEADQLRARLSALSAETPAPAGNERDLLVSGETPARR
jgi:DNA-binding SARP family transcriptional activator